MKAKMIAIIIALSCLASAAWANNSSYYPPERIHCRINNSNLLSCEAFNRQYLSEDTTNADLQSRDKTFYFYSSVAYLTSNEDVASVFYTYHNAENKMVKLKTINAAITPDFEKGNWKRFNEDIYICDAGYLECPITNLPSARK